MKFHQIETSQEILFVKAQTYFKANDEADVIYFGIMEWMIMIVC